MLSFARSRSLKKSKILSPSSLAPALAVSLALGLGLGLNCGVVLCVLLSSAPVLLDNVLAGCVSVVLFLLIVSLL